MILRMLERGMITKDNGEKLYLVYSKGEWPKPKRVLRGSFDKRRRARQWCRKHSWEEGLMIVAPDGSEEIYVVGAIPVLDVSCDGKGIRR